MQVIHRVASRRAGGGGTVPVLVTPEGVFAESADILAYADRHGAPPAVPGGRCTPRSSPSSATSTPTWDPRADAGCTSISSPGKDLGTAYNCTGVPAGERRAFPRARSRAMSGYIRRLFAIGPETGAQAGGRGRSARSTRSPRGWSTAARYPCGEALHRGRPRLRRTWPRPRSSRPSTARPPRAR